MKTPVTVGIVYIVASAFGISLNCLAIRGIFARGKLKKNHSSMYILYLQPLITDVLYQLNYMFYAAPSVMIQRHLFYEPVGQYVVYILDSIQLYCWMSNSLSQISLALNRFIVTVLLHLNFFTRSRTISLCVFQHLIAAAISVTAQFIIPCCRLEFDFSIFSFREVYINGVPNDSWILLKRPVQVACSVIPLVIYTWILLTTRSIGRKVNLKSSELNKRRKQELRFAVQFASLAAIYTLSWTVFSYLPVATLIQNQDWIRGMSVILGIVNATTNAVLFLLNDSKQLCSFCIASSPNGSTH